MLGAQGMDFGLSGRRVLVTAGAAGIGRAIADGFIAAGARVHVCDISDEALGDFRATHPDHSATRTDVADRASIDALFDEVYGLWGGLDVLINNAGIAGPTAPVEEIADPDWHRTIAVNLDSHFYALTRAVPMLKATNDGCIVALSSIAGRLGYAYRLPYAATKWAVVGMVKSLAIELGSAGIRVNAVLPGVVQGPRIQAVIAARAATLGVTHETMEAEYRGKASLDRMVTAEDIANTILFLCSNAGRNISGQAISVDGNVVAL
ncbi:SDR family oxidoreductase [Azospirillum canadense]|uniref:SDR family oxidoreductase n=1 Tax=Azospirillum canadense TaxID=403962 RepID=UPI0022277BC6|nr:SDR family oxidoreductase [Azospirillum canadense]MCW2241116.1 NAD(P)-dependent dehydrogenase (short-subunit alcohol dehydrogenase family) [Azospirillum canadense]